MMNNSEQYDLHVKKLNNSPACIDENLYRPGQIVSTKNSDFPMKVIMSKNGLAYCTYIISELLYHEVLNQTNLIPL